MGTAHDDTPDVLHCVVAGAAYATGEVLAEFLQAADITNFSSEANAELDTCEVRIYCDDAESARAVLTQLRDQLPGWADGLFNPADVRLGVATMQREDWAESWKRHFKPIRVSQRLVVKPSWEDFTSGPDDVVLELDPGMSFGTGQHGTTKACLQYLDELQYELGEVSVLDAGCGSGILSMAACKLGYAPIAAFDHDPAAARVAEENLAEAGCSSVQVRCADLAAFSPDGRARVVLANILAPILIKYAEQIVSFADTAGKVGYLVLSGILHDQYAGVKARFESLGARERDSRRIDEWTSGCFELPPE